MWVGARQNKECWSERKIFPVGKELCVEAAGGGGDVTGSSITTRTLGRVPSVSVDRSVYVVKGMRRLGPMVADNYDGSEILAPVVLAHLHITDGRATHGTDTKAHQGDPIHVTTHVAQEGTRT